MTKHDERIIVKLIRRTGKTGMQKSKKNMHMQKKMIPKEVGCGQEEMIR